MRVYIVLMVYYLLVRLPDGLWINLDQNVLLVGRAGFAIMFILARRRHWPGVC